jgi:cyanophycinase-like exopeptidase
LADLAVFRLKGVKIVYKFFFQLAAAIVVMTSIGAQPVLADPAITHTFVPTGSGYEPDTLQRFALAAAQRDTNGMVDIVVLPITFATDAYNISNGERQKNLDLANTRRGQVETACNAVKSPGQICRAVLVPALVRADAYLQSNLDLFAPDLDGMYILGGDQTIAMLMTVNTPLEARMASAFTAGAVVGGNSAGAAVESINMIGGYTGNNGPENGLQRGSVDLWLPDGADDVTRGLSFGLTNMVLDQHEFQRGRIGRLINVAFTTGLPGVGADAETAATIVDGATLTDVVGNTAAFVIDLDTYNAAGQFGGPTSSLALRGAVTHLIPPGGFGYDFVHMRPLANGIPLPAPSLGGRRFGSLQLPGGYGPLLLSGDLRGDRSGLAAQRFVALSGGQSGAHLVVIALGYARSTDAQADAKAYASALQFQVSAPVQWFVLDAKTNQSAVAAAIGDATGVLVTAADQSRVMNAIAGAPGVVSALHAAWAGGKTILADNAAAAALGQSMSADPTPSSSSLEDDSVGDFLLAGVDVHPGLNWLPGVIVEPRLLPDRHWGRLYNQIFRDPSLLGLGVDVDTALEITEGGAVVRGRSAVLVLDGRYGSFALGANGALGARYVLLDSYVDGGSLVP